MELFLRVSDIGQSAEFYKEMGFSLPKIDLEARVAVLEKGGLVVAIYEGEDETLASRRIVSLNAYRLNKQN